MQQYKKILGKVMLTAEGIYNSNKGYGPISLITDEETGKSYISRKEVPSGTQINNREYWQPVASSGIIDNGVIILNRKNSDGQVPIYDLKSAAEAVAVGDRKAGVILGFLGFNPETDTVPTWKLYQYNDVSPSNWTNIDYWLPMDYTNKYAGWFDNEEALYDSVPFPKVGMYAYVGNSATSAIIYRCYIDRTWQATEDKAFGGVVNLADEEDITSKQNKLKFKDKEYNPAQFSGLGKLYLRKNIVDRKNILTQTMIQATNTIYIIQYDYDLQGETITIPENCVLQFEGGSLNNGTINFNYTNLANFIKFRDIQFEGILSTEYIDISWFDEIGNGEDATDAIKTAVSWAKNNWSNEQFNKKQGNTIIFPSGTYKIYDTINIPYIVNIKGIGKVCLISYADIAFRFSSENIQMYAPNANYRERGHIWGYSINSDNVFGIYKSNTSADIRDEAANSIGILIGDETYTSGLLPYANKIINNVIVSGFTKGVCIIQNNVFLHKISNSTFQLNKYGVYMEGTSNNSGENVRIDDCIFSNNFTAFRLKGIQNGQTTFNNCSLDFNAANIVVSDHGKIVFNNGHIEGIGYQSSEVTANEDNTPGFGTIFDKVDKYTARCYITFNNTHIDLNTHNPKILIPNRSLIYAVVTNCLFDIKYSLAVEKGIKLSNITQYDLYNNIYTKDNRFLPGGLEAGILLYNDFLGLGGAVSIGNSGNTLDMSSLNSYNTLFNVPQNIENTYNVIEEGPINKCIDFNFNISGNISFSRLLKEGNYLISALLNDSGITTNGGTSLDCKYGYKFEYLNNNNELIKSEYFGITLDFNYVYSIDNWKYLYPIIIKVPNDTTMLVTLYTTGDVKGNIKFCGLIVNKN